MSKNRLFEKQRHLAPVAQLGELTSGLGVQPQRKLGWSMINVNEIVSRLMLVAILVAGGALRLWQINSLGFNSDEAVYAGQGAAIAADPTLKEIFPMFRAHPLLFQFILSLGFRFTGVNDLIGRLFSVVAGLATLYIVYQLGTLLYNRKVGLCAALFMALMPYHVIVTRQVLLDGPMVLFSTLTLYMMARFATTQRPAWLYAAGVGMGLTFLTKETGIILLGAIYVFLSLSPAIRVRMRDLIVSMVCMVAVIVPHFITLSLVGRTKTAQQFLLWQLFRRSNHELDFYISTVPFVIGPLVILVAVIGLWLLRRERTWRETLLVAWVLVPTVFFQLWPVKGFQYLLPIAPALALLAARAVIRLGQDQPLVVDHGFNAPAARRLRSIRMPAWGRGIERGMHAAGLRVLALIQRPLAALRISRRFASILLVLLIASSIMVPSWHAVNRVISDEFLAGTGGVPGGREAGLWVRENIPEGAKLVAIGPSMANIIQFYGHRRTYGLSVSSNPLHRNPVYEPVVNPDKLIRNGELQYFIYDAFSASRTTHFADSLLTYVQRYHGRAIHTESVTVTLPDGTTAVKPIIVIYEVWP